MLLQKLQTEWAHAVSRLLSMFDRLVTSKNIERIFYAEELLLTWLTSADVDLRSILIDRREQITSFSSSTLDKHATAHVEDRKETAGSLLVTSQPSNSMLKISIPQTCPTAWISCLNSLELFDNVPFNSTITSSAWPYISRSSKVHWKVQAITLRVLTWQEFPYQSHVRSRFQPVAKHSSR